RTNSDLIRITVRADDPHKAAAIASAWARHYVALVNSIYNQVPVEIVESVEHELQQASEEYEAAQKSLESFIAESRIKDLENQIARKTALLINYQVAERELISSTIQLDHATRLKLFTD